MPRRRLARLVGSVRVRTTVAATLIVAVALSVGAGVLVERFRVSLETNRQDAAVARATDIASLAASGRLPVLLSLSNENATLAQVVGGSGRVLAASANLGGEPAVGPPLPAGASLVVRDVTQLPVGQGNHFGLVALPAHSKGRPVTVYTAFSFATSDLAVRDVTTELLFGLPLLLVVVAGTTWLVVGRALRPIDAIRAEVAEITTRDLHRRFPEPATDDEVARLARTMNSMLDRLEVSVERQRAFVADASHELRSPLTSLRAQLEVGLARGPATDWRSTVVGALAEEARIERLISDLLLLARIDGGGLAMPGDTVDLAEVVTADLAARSPRGGVEVRVSSLAPAPVAMSPELGRRVVVNLVDNAQRHAASRVDVAIGHPTPDLVELTVHDDGPGIAAEDRDRVFERFTRLDPSRASDDGGAGLGLAIVRDIVTRHRGWIGFVDAPRGALIVVRLLASSAPAASPDPTPSAGSAARSIG